MDDLYKVGTVSKVRQMFRLPGNNVRLIVEGGYRARLVDIVQSESYFIAEVAQINEKDSERSSKKKQALVRETRKHSKTMEAAPGYQTKCLSRCCRPMKRATCGLYNADISIRYTEKQEVLEIVDKTRRLEKVCSILYRETELLELEENPDKGPRPDNQEPAGLFPS